MRHKFREQLRSREALAILHTPKDAARTRADIMDLLCGEPVKPNEDCGAYVVVHIRGPLEQRNCGYGDSYEQIRQRFGEALKTAKKNGGCVVLRIDSPGGVVAGLNQAVYDMTRAKKNMGVDVLVYADELIASAAYAITCVGDAVYLPPSAHVGSVGVISTMVDTVKADEKAGLNFVTLTTGARKDDGHPHTAISKDAIAEERKRVDALGQQFFRIVERARGVNAAPLEANLFLGRAAVKAGLADEVLGWEQLLVDIQEVYGSGKADTGSEMTHPETETSEDEMLKLKAMIKRVQAQLATEKDAKKRSALAARLGAFEATLDAYKKTYKKETEEETEEGGDDEEEEEEGGNDTDRSEDDMPEDEPEKDKSEEGDAPEKSEEGDAPEKSEEDDKEEKSAEDDKEEKAKAEDDDGDKDAFSTPGKRAAIMAKAKAWDAAQGDIKRLVVKDARKEKLSTIAAARAAGRITKAHAKMLEKKSSKFVDDFLSMHKSALVYSIDEESPETIPSDNGPKSAVGDIPPDVMRQFISAANASKGTVTIETLIANYKKELAAGAARY